MDENERITLLYKWKCACEGVAVQERVRKPRFKSLKSAKDERKKEASLQATKKYMLTSYETAMGKVRTGEVPDSLGDVLEQLQNFNWTLMNGPYEYEDVLKNLL